MTLFSLICCLLALSSSAFGRSTYGSYSAGPTVIREQPLAIQLPTQTQGQIQTGYGAQLPQQQTLVLPSGYGAQNVLTRTLASPNQLLLEQQQMLQQKIQESQIPTEADILCRGQRPETVIPLDSGRRFVVCLDDGKGDQQECPQGLLYHPETRRCERKLGALANPCETQPCLNGGQCIVSPNEPQQYQCQCPIHFDGKNCELDARVCQSQNPCGLSPDTRCQSFRWGAALTHMCIFQNGLGYGLSAQQVHPSPCTGGDGPRPLANSEKGFVMCDGEFMFVESCPGGTLWDGLNKACVWPDMQGILSLSTPEQTIVSRVPAHHHQQRLLQSSYGGSIQTQRPLVSEEQRLPTGYGQSSYGGSLQSQRSLVSEEQRLPSGYGQSGYGQQGSAQPIGGQSLGGQSFGSQQQNQQNQQNQQDQQEQFQPQQGGLRMQQQDQFQPQQQSHRMHHHHQGGLRPQQDQRFQQQSGYQQ